MLSPPRPSSQSSTNKNIYTIFLLFFSLFSFPTEANKKLWIIKINLFQSINYAGNRTAVADVCVYLCMCWNPRHLFAYFFFLSCLVFFFLLSLLPNASAAACRRLKCLNLKHLQFIQFQMRFNKEKFVSLYVDDSLSHV